LESAKPEKESWESWKAGKPESWKAKKKHGKSISYDIYESILKFVL